MASGRALSPAASAAVLWSNKQVTTKFGVSSQVLRRNSRPGPSGISTSVISMAAGLNHRPCTGQHALQFRVLKYNMMIPNTGMSFLILQNCQKPHADGSGNFSHFPPQNPLLTGATSSLKQGYQTQAVHSSSTNLVLNEQVHPCNYSVGHCERSPKSKGGEITFMCNSYSHWSKCFCLNKAKDKHLQDLTCAYLAWIFRLLEVANCRLQTSHL